MPMNCRSTFAIRSLSSMATLSPNFPAGSGPLGRHFVI